MDRDSVIYGYPLTYVLRHVLLYPGAETLVRRSRAVSDSPSLCRLRIPSHGRHNSPATAISFGGSRTTMPHDVLVIIRM